MVPLSLYITHIYISLSDLVDFPNPVDNPHI